MFSEKKNNVSASILCVGASFNNCQASNYFLDLCQYKVTVMEPLKPLFNAKKVKNIFFWSRPTNLSDKHYRLREIRNKFIKHWILLVVVFMKKFILHSCEDSIFVLFGFIVHIDFRRLRLEPQKGVILLKIIIFLNFIQIIWIFFLLFFWRNNLQRKPQHSLHWFLVVLSALKFETNWNTICVCYYVSQI